jgi:hypothetical protein
VRRSALKLENTPMIIDRWWDIQDLWIVKKPA